MPRPYTPNAYTGTVIPTMLLFGLLAGRWWRAALIAAAFVWPALLLAGGVIDSAGDAVGASVLGATNAAIGVVVHQVVRLAYRRLAPV